jgi:hypothetical protein
VRRRSPDIPGQQIVAPVHGMLADAGEDLAQVGLGLETIEFRRANERMEDRGPNVRKLRKAQY